MWRMTRRAALVGMILGSVGCATERTDPVTPLPTGTTSPVGVAPVPAAVQPEIWLAAAQRELLVGTSFVLEGTALPANGIPDTTVALEWRATVDGIVSLQTVGTTRVRVRGDRPGSTWLSVSALGISRSIPVTVLPAADPGATSTVVIDDFRVVQFRLPLDSQWIYSPQLVLSGRDGITGSAVIGASFDISGLQPSPWCAMLRVVGGGTQKLFWESYHESEFEIRQAGRIAVPGDSAVAHLTVRLLNNTAMTLTVKGPIVSSPIPLTDDWPVASYGDYLSCG